MATLDNCFKFVVYVWNESTNYFSDSESVTNNVFLSSSALMFHLNGILENLIEDISKRSDFKFIHSELGPNHVMVDKNNNAYIIDIEGARFFDLEYEESFLKIRFNNNYKYLKSYNLDKKRMTFYHICYCCGNLSGAYELLYKNYYDTEDVLGMIN